FRCITPRLPPHPTARKSSEPRVVTTREGPDAQRRRTRRRRTALPTTCLPLDYRCILDPMRAPGLSATLAGASPCYMGFRGVLHLGQCHPLGALGSQDPHPGGCILAPGASTCDSRFPVRPSGNATSFGASLAVGF
ncbi:MAG: hypothetical protein BJ554DRAFT_7465, partial [Olpidium bornovanus]